MQFFSSQSLMLLQTILSQNLKSLPYLIFTLSNILSLAILSLTQILTNNWRQIDIPSISLYIKELSYVLVRVAMGWVWIGYTQTQPKNFTREYSNPRIRLSPIPNVYQIFLTCGFPYRPKPCFFKHLKIWQNTQIISLFFVTFLIIKLFYWTCMLVYKLNKLAI